MLTQDQVVDLLTAISAYDNRKPNAAAVMAWSKAAELGRWTLPEALDAVHAHFCEDPAYLMPAHITARVKAVREDRASRSAAPKAVEAAPVDPVAAKRVEAIVDNLAKSMGWSGERRESLALKVRCPHCGAAPGSPCTAPTTGRALTQSPCHPSRAEAMADLMRGGAA